MKSYTGYRILDRRGLCTQVAVRVHEPDREAKPLEPRYDLRRHSDGFEWGYSGSGPAQLALALAADVLGNDEEAQDVYQELKRRVVARLAPDGWSLTEEQLRQTIRDLQEERGRGTSL